MKRVARFSKVSRSQFIKDAEDIFPNLSREEIIAAYENINIPLRATKGSAGYDFFLPFRILLDPKQSVRVPTGIRVEIEEGWVLTLYPRSGLGFRYRLQLDNTVGVIDSDYYYADNEGHIIVKMTSDTNLAKPLALDSGQGFVQGIFLEYGITYEDDSVAQRHGGFGSTTLT